MVKKKGRKKVTLRRMSIADDAKKRGDMSLGKLRNSLQASAATKTYNVSKITDNVFTLNKDLAKYRLGQLQLKQKLQQEFANKTGDVLNKQTLDFLVQQANIPAPTITSIIAGFELARASNADRKERFTNSTIKNIDEQTRIAGQLTKDAVGNELSGLQTVNDQLKVSDRVSEIQLKNDLTNINKRADILNDEISLEQKDQDIATRQANELELIDKRNEGRKTSLSKEEQANQSEKDILLGLGGGGNDKSKVDSEVTTTGTQVDVPQPVTGNQESSSLDRQVNSVESTGTRSVIDQQDNDSFSNASYGLFGDDVRNIETSSLKQAATSNSGSDVVYEPSPIGYDNSNQKQVNESIVGVVDVLNKENGVSIDPGAIQSQMTDAGFDMSAVTPDEVKSHLQDIADKEAKKQAAEAEQRRLDGLEMQQFENSDYIMP